jgi:hypothetical protein
MTDTGVSAAYGMASECSRVACFWMVATCKEERCLFFHQIKAQRQPTCRFNRVKSEGKGEEKGTARLQSKCLLEGFEVNRRRKGELPTSADITQAQTFNTNKGTKGESIFCYAGNFTRSSLQSDKTTPSMGAAPFLLGTE